MLDILNITLLKKTLDYYKNYGFSKLMLILLRYLNTRYKLYREKQFDKKYEIETSKHIIEPDLKVESTNKECSFGYEPILKAAFFSSMKHLNIPHKDYVFIDLGAGKGRALFFASTFEFKQLIGVEFSKEIYNIAKKNIFQFQKISKKNLNLNFLYMDAEKYSFPEENIVLYLYNPFRGEVLDNVISNIKQHVENTTKDFIIIYHYPMYSALYDKQSFLKLQICTKEYCIYGRS